MGFRHTHALALACFAALYLAPAMAQTADPLVTQAKAFSADLAQARACKWLSPYDEIALNGKIMDTIARARIGIGAQAGNAVETAAKVLVKPDPCDAEADGDKQDQVALLRLEWLARADTMYTISASAPFGKDMTSLGATHALRRERFSAMRDAFIGAAGAEQWSPIFDGIVADSRSTVGLACTDRINFMTKTPRACPTIPDTAKKYIPMAVAQLKNIEAFAAAFAAAAAKADAAAPAAR